MPPEATRWRQWRDRELRKESMIWVESQEGTIHIEMVNYWQFHEVPVIKPGHPSLPRDPESNVCLYCVDSSAVLPHHQTTEGHGPRVRSLKQPGERPLKSFF